MRIAVGTFIAITVLCLCCGEKRRSAVDHITSTILSDTLTGVPTGRHFAHLSTASQLIDTTQLWVGGSGVAMFFEKGRVTFVHSLKCDGTYPIEVRDDKLTVYWVRATGCPVRYGLDKTFSSVQAPVAGRPFADISIVNDSILFVKYLYPDWIEELHRHLSGQDTLFPNVFFRER